MSQDLNNLTYYEYALEVNKENIAPTILNK